MRLSSLKSKQNLNETWFNLLRLQHTSPLLTGGYICFHYSYLNLVDLVRCFWVVYSFPQATDQMVGWEYLEFWDRLCWLVNLLLILVMLMKYCLTPTRIWHKSLDWPCLELNLTYTFSGGFWGQNLTGNFKKIEER